MVNKRRVGSFVVGCLLVILLVGALPTVALANSFADTLDKKAPSDICNELRVVRVETKIVSDIVSAEKSKLSDKVGISQIGSKVVVIQSTAYSLAGVALWDFYHRVYWTWDALRITSVQRSAWGVVYAPLWEYFGLVGNTGYYYNSNRSYYSFYQGHFRLGTGGIYVQQRYPWIEIKVHRGGSFSWTAGG